MGAAKLPEYTPDQMDPRKCQICQNEATVHEVTVRQGVRVERHLCESCAQQAGIPVHSSAPINELISKYIMSQGPDAVVVQQSKTPAPAPKVTTCPGCSMTFAEFKQSGHLGCPECYSAFEAQLSGVIERFHGGAGQHVGKQPLRGESAAAQGKADASRNSAIEERARRMQLLRQQLEEAVRTEQYERAVKLRDELRRFDQP